MDKHTYPLFGQLRVHIRNKRWTRLRSTLGNTRAFQRPGRTSIKIQMIRYDIFLKKKLRNLKSYV